VSTPNRIAILGALAALTALLCLPLQAQASFGVKSLSATSTNADGTLDAQAGSHPYEHNVSFVLNQDAAHNVEGSLRTAIVELPPGLFGNPQGLPQCPRVKLENSLGLCPPNTQVGITRVSFGGSLTATTALYNLVPPPGVPARFGFSITGFSSFQDAVLDSDGYGISIVDDTVPTNLNIKAVSETIWGVPADPRHDPERTCLDSKGQATKGCGTDVPLLPFFTLPTSCAAPLKTSLRVESLEEPGILTAPFDAFSLEGAGNPAPQAGCLAVPFAPKIAASPSSRLAENGSGLDFELKLPNVGLLSPNGITETEPEKVEVTLPEGVTINPSAAEGIGVCAPAQYGAEKLSSKPGQGCPEASKLGSLVAHTPLLDETIEGSLYLAKPFDNPSNSLLGLYIVARAQERGILIKQAGKVAPDPKTGQLITTFDGLPPLPYSDFKLHFREGGRAPLVTPPACGSYQAVAKLTPFSIPDRPVSVSGDFKIEGGVNGGPCPPGGAPPFKPDFEAGSNNNNAKSYSPFYMRLQRHDGEQDMTKFSSILPPGVLGKLAGVSKCPDSAIAVAKAKSGLQEIASPSCPANSQIGRVLAGAGVGSVLTYVKGKIYLGGPYNGDPLSVIVITPAVAGPFDVGTVIVREALTLNPVTAEVEVDGKASDPIPHILAGIPLKVRDLRVYVDRDDFIINPTSCDPSQAKATLFGSFLDVFNPADDVPVSLADRFQAANCANLGFKPKLSIQLKGGTKRGDHPALKAVVNTRSADANIGGATVTLPKSAFLDQAHIRTICTRVQYAANGGSGGGCPKAAQYGYAKALTPLLNEPVEGPVYLRSSNHKLPDLVAALHGLVNVDVVGRIDSFKGGIRSSFETTPDAPVSKFILTMQGGQKGLVVNSRNLCAGTNRADAQFVGQNGKPYDFRPVVGASCGGRKRK
jgi:hypothetical protein